MHILHILDHSIPLHSGYTFRTRNILRQQRKLGWRTSHVTGSKHTGAAAAEEDFDGLHFYRTRGGDSLLERLPVLNQLQVINSLADRLLEVIDREQPDILHAHSPALNGVAALRAAKKCGLPVVYECRAFWEDAAVDHGTSREWGIRYRLTRAMETRVFREADAVTTICEGLRGDIIGRGIDPQKITVIPNAVDLEDFSASGEVDSELRSSLALEGRLVLGFIGSFYAYEGLPLLVEALHGLCREIPEVVLLLVGGGPDEAIIRERIEGLNLQDKVIMTGRVPHHEVQRYYNLVDIFVYPRLSMRLTDLVTPLKPLEAMAQERLVVASDVGGHRELIESGSNGYLFEANNVASLSAAVSQLISRKEQWDGIRARARHFVEQERSWEASVARYCNVYGELR